MKEKRERTGRNLKKDEKEVGKNRINRTGRKENGKGGKNKNDNEKE